MLIKHYDDRLWNGFKWKKKREIMKRFQIKNNAMKCKSKTDLIECKKHHNIVVQLNKCCKKQVFDSLETKK